MQGHHKDIKASVSVCSHNKLLMVLSVLIMIGFKDSTSYIRLRHYRCDSNTFDVATFFYPYTGKWRDKKSSYPPYSRVGAWPLFSLCDHLSRVLSDKV